MAYYQSTIVTNRAPAPTAYHSDVVVQKGIVPLSAAVAANDIAEACVLPAGHVLCDSVFESDDLDTNGTPTVSWNIGLMSGTVGVADAARTVGTQLASASTLSRTGGMERLASRAALGILPVDVDRSIGLKAAGAAATGVATLTNLNVNRGFWLPATVYAANDYITLPNGLRAKCTSGGTSAATMTDAFGTTAYNTDITDGGVTWRIADPYVALTIYYRAARFGI